MAILSKLFLLVSLAVAFIFGLVSAGQPPKHRGLLKHIAPELIRRGIPAEPKGVKTITSPNGVSIRYKEPGKEGVCETTPGVNSYSGYVDLDNNTHMFFWFFEARKDPANAPITLWLNGGPGSDSLIGLFQELGPCNVTKDLKTELNPYAWNEYSNMLFLSQPIGVGFSYATEVVGVLDDFTNYPVASNKPDGRYANVDEFRIDTTALAAVGAWEILQGFMANLPKLDSKIKSRTFNLWTESYGGHYGPAFFDYFSTQNAKIASGKCSGVKLTMDTLGIGNGIISEKIQAPYYPEFAYKNQYGIQAVNESIYNFMKTAYYIPQGCSDQIDYCEQYAQHDGISTVDGKVQCSQATAICRNLVEYPYYVYSGRGTYDIRVSEQVGEEQPPQYFIDYLNQASTQNAIGVNLNYTQDSSSLIYGGFSYTGDFVYESILTDMERLLNSSVRVALYYGDADYICNWFGGQAVSNQVEYTHAKEFRAAGYTPFVVDGVEYGEVKQYGNFSFLRIYEAGHEVPYYQPKASLAMFERTLKNQVIADGSPLKAGYSSHGDASATHTESYVALPTSTAASASASGSAAAHIFKA